jgi:hypothetical protein
MAMTPKMKMDWMEGQNRLHRAASEADAIVANLRLSAPVDPLAIVRSEEPLIRAGGKVLGDLYDGKLEYLSDRNLFLLLFNTKYDAGRLPRDHHPRTRFSISHELGHYFLPKHRAHLMKRKTPHDSKGELRSDIWVEREADTFAASILLPKHLAGPAVNKGPLSHTRIRDISTDFKASPVCTTFRAVTLSDFPCAVAGIRNGRVAWTFSSESLINAGIYPSKGGCPANAEEPWADFQAGVAEPSEAGGVVSDWFQTFQREDLDKVYVHEEYIPVPSMGTLLVLLTVDEADVYGTGEDDGIDDD